MRLLRAALLAVVAGLPSAAFAQAPVAPAPGQRVILVTGATNGLGREVALRLAAAGAHVIVHGRDSARGLAVVDEIRQAGKGSARFLAADLASNADVRRLAETVLRDYSRLDVLINNAGLGSVPRERVVTEEGHEIRFQVNHLSGFLLTHLLLPRLKASAPARIVNVSSLSASPIDFDDVMIERNFSGGRAYGQSKLAQVMFTFDLAPRLEGSGVIVNALHPSTMMPTGMVAAAGLPPRSTIDDGAKAVLQLVDGEVGSGGFFNVMVPAKAHAQAYDPEVRSRLWQLSERLTGLK